MDTFHYLGLHILNRIYSRLLLDGARLDEMHLVEALQTDLISECVQPIDAKIVWLLGDINLWIDWHEVPEVR